MPAPSGEGSRAAQRTAPTVHWSVWVFFCLKTHPAFHPASCHNADDCPASWRASCPADPGQIRFSRSRRARRRSPDAKKFAVEGIGTMQTHIPDGKAILAQIERPYGRSLLFEWLFLHHDEVIAAAAGRRLGWSRLCAEFAKAGLTGADGKPVNAITARMTWWRVRKERERIEALRAAEPAERERRAGANPCRDARARRRSPDAKTSRG